MAGDVAHVDFTERGIMDGITLVHRHSSSEVDGCLINTPYGAS